MSPNASTLVFILNQSELMREAVPNTPIVSFPQPPNLRKLLQLFENAERFLKMLSDNKRPGKNLDCWQIRQGIARY